jgi:hypothetical protein
MVLCFRKRQIRQVHARLPSKPRVGNHSFNAEVALRCFPVAVGCSLAHKPVKACIATSERNIKSLTSWRNSAVNCVRDDPSLSGHRLCLLVWKSSLIGVDVRLSFIQRAVGIVLSASKGAVDRRLYRRGEPDVKHDLRQDMEGWMVLQNGEYWSLVFSFPRFRRLQSKLIPCLDGNLTSHEFPIYSTPNCPS